MNLMSKPLVAACSILLGLGTLGWALWMFRRYWRDDDPGAKHRRTETIMPRPFLMGFLGAAIMPLLTLLVLLELRNETPQLNTLLWLLGIGLVLSVFLVCYGARQLVIYDSGHLRCRPVFGKMRTYDFSEVRSMTPIVADLLVRVGRRWILLDFQQDWYPLYETYRLWRIRNGLPVKKREYKTGLGRAFGQIPGGTGILTAITFLLSFGAVLFFVVMLQCFRSGAVGSGIVSLLFCLFSAVSLFLFLFSAANREKYPRLAKIMMPNFAKYRAAEEEMNKQTGRAARRTE